MTLNHRNWQNTTPLATLAHNLFLEGPQLLNVTDLEVLKDALSSLLTIVQIELRERGASEPLDTA